MPGRARQRLFTAIDPPLAVREELAAWARAQRGGSRGIRVIAPASIHLTLTFLGEREAGEAEAIASAMASCAQHCGRPSPLKTGQPIALPSKRPRVLAASISDRAGELAALRDELALELEHAIGWDERRSFRPHLTLARLSREATLPREFAPLPRLRFECEELVLYRSHLEPSGARYEAIERVALN